VTNSILERMIVGIESMGVKRYGMNKIIAEKTGYSVGTVAKIMKGHAVLTDRFQIAACSAFGINEKWVLEGKKPILAIDQLSRFIPTNDRTGNNPMVFQGNRLVEIRDMLGYSPEEMAQQLNLKDVSSLQQYEQSVFIENVHILVNLAHLGINLNWFLTGLGEKRLMDQWPISITTEVHNKRGPRTVTYELDDLFTTRLKRQLGKRTIEWFSNETKIELIKLNKIFSGETIPLVNELETIAKAFGNMNPRWLADRSPIEKENWEFEYYKHTDSDQSYMHLRSEYQTAFQQNIASLHGLNSFSPETEERVIDIACRVHMKELPESKEVNIELLKTLLSCVARDLDCTCTC